MFLYDNWILNPKLAPIWFTNVKVIEITPSPGVSGTGLDVTVVQREAARRKGKLYLSQVTHIFKSLYLKS